MGLFDLFKKKKTEAPTPPPAPQPAPVQEIPVAAPSKPAPQSQPVQEAPVPQTQMPEPIPELYVGDLEKTDTLARLVAVPHNQRNAQWEADFMQNLTGASFRCGDPQVVTGPDGFPYFQLFLPEPNQPFDCFVIDRMKDDFLLRDGIGVVINPNGNNADWVLTYGDLLNLQLNGTLYSTGETPFSKSTSNEVVQDNEQVMIGNPSPTILSKESRVILANYLKINNVANPKILMMMRQLKSGNGVSQDLVFNVTPQLFPDAETYHSVMQALAWYLPKHYSYAGMDEATFTNGFVAL